jgi:hypothetical protein
MTPKNLFASALLTIALSLCASADVINGPTYPPPGNVTFSPGSGSTITAGGKTNTYSNLDPTQYGQLWWSATVANPYDSSYNPSGTGNMKFVGLVGTNEYEWQSTAPLTFQDPANNNTVQINTQFYLTINGGTYDAAASAVTNVPMFDISGTGFSVNLLYESAGSPLGPVYNSYNHACTGGCLQTSLDGEFYYTNPPTTTPEPSSIALLSSGLLGVAGFARRKMIRKN